MIIFFEPRKIFHIPLTACKLNCISKKAANIFYVFEDYQDVPLYRRKTIILGIESCNKILVAVNS